MSRRTKLALLAGAVTGALLVSPAGPASACGGGPNFETFEVRTKWNKKVYKPGETLRVEVTVLRPARRDPMGMGIELEPPAQTPVEGAKVVVAFTVGVPPVFGIGETDEAGQVVLRIPLKTKARGGIQSTTRASITYNESGPDCTNVEEWGRLVETPAFEIRN